MKRIVTEEAIVFSAQDHRMISLDRPGYGLSDFQEDRTYLDWPDDVIELADHLARSASRNFPQSVLTGDTFSGSRVNRLLIWSANNGPWLMRTLFRIMRILIFSDPVGLFENSGEGNMPAKNKQFFTRGEYIAAMVEAFRQGVEGMTRDFTIERLDWLFELEGIHAPTVLVFHGEEDAGVRTGIGEYVCKRIPSCDESTIFPGEGHSVVYYRYEEIVNAMLEAWE